MAIGKTLSRILKEKHIEQAELADYLGIARSTLNGIILRDSKKIEIDLLIKICDFLDCDVEEFYSDYQKDKNLKMPRLFCKKYLSLDDHGKELVNMILDTEYERCQEQAKGD